MLKGLIGGSTTVAALKEGLTDSTERARGIAHRVANASTPGDHGFAAALDGIPMEAMEEEVDLEREMVALADERLRFETTSRLLQKVYQQIRSSVRER